MIHSLMRRAMASTGRGRFGGIVSLDIDSGGRQQVDQFFVAAGRWFAFGGSEERPSPLHVAKLSEQGHQADWSGVNGDRAGKPLGQHQSGRQRQGSDLARSGHEHAIGMNREVVRGRRNARFDGGIQAGISRRSSGQEDRPSTANRVARGPVTSRAT